MMNRIVSAAFAASLLCATAGVTVMLGSSAAFAADTNKVSAAVAKPLSEALKAAQGGDMPGALAKLTEAQAVASRTPFDDYKINAILAYVAIQQKDYATATTATEFCANSPVIPQEEKLATFKNALVLASAAKQYQKAVVYGQNLVALNGLDKATEAQLAIDYYELKDMANAKDFAQKSVDLAKAAGTAPDPNALRILMSAQVGQNDQAGAEQTLEALVLADPDNASDAWRQLVDVTLGIKGIRDLDALYLFRLKVVAGAMTQSDDYTTLGGVAAQLGYPTEAVTVMQQGISSGKLTSGQAGETLIKARKDAAQDERLLGSIAAAAEKSKTGEQDVKLGEDYWGYGRYADAEAAARRAVAKGGLKDPAEGPLLIGIAEVAQGKYDEAQQTFAQINNTPAKTKVAHMWSLYAQAKAKKAPATPPAPAATPAH